MTLRARTAPPPAAGDRRNRPFKRDMLLCLLGGAAVCGVVAALVEVKQAQLRESAIRGGFQEAQRLTHVLASQLELTFSVADAALRRVGAGPPCAGPVSRNPALAQIGRELPSLAVLTVYDAEGRALCTSGAMPPGGFDARDRDYFARLRADPLDGPYVGVPVLSRLSGQWVLPVARRLESPDGTFAGVVATGLAVAPLQKLFESVRPGASGSVTFYRDDKRLLVRVPHDERLIGTLADRAQIWSSYPASRSGTVEGAAAATDGVQRVAAYVGLESTGTVVAVATAVDDALADWRAEVRADGAVNTVVYTLVMAMAWMLGLRVRALRLARSEAEDQRLAAQEAVKAKDMFMANMSHELRTPLNAVIGFADLALTLGVERIGAGRTVEYMRDIRRSGLHLLDLINDVLDLSKIDSGGRSLDLAAHDPAALAAEAVEMVEQGACSRGVRIELSAGGAAQAFCDRRAALQCLLNIVSNAVKFSPDGSAVAVRVIASRDEVRFVVADRGPGMPDEIRMRVGKPFLRAADPSLSSIEGTGLGLAISKRLAELQDGRLELAAEPGQGTVATLVLRAAPPPPA